MVLSRALTKMEATKLSELARVKFEAESRRPRAGEELGLSEPEEVIAPVNWTRGLAVGNSTPLLGSDTGDGRSSHNAQQAPLITRAQQTEPPLTGAFVIGGLFLSATLVVTVSAIVFCRKRNTVFVLQHCEQDYALGASHLHYRNRYALASSSTTGFRPHERGAEEDDATASNQYDASESDCDLETSVSTETVCNHSFGMETGLSRSLTLGSGDFKPGGQLLMGADRLAESHGALSARADEAVPHSGFAYPAEDSYKLRSTKRQVRTTRRPHFFSWAVYQTRSSLVPVAGGPEDWGNEIARRQARLAYIRQNRSLLKSISCHTSLEHPNRTENGESRRSFELFVKALARQMPKSRQIERLLAESKVPVDAEAFWGIPSNIIEKHEDNLST